MYRHADQTTLPNGGAKGVGRPWRSPRAGPPTRIAALDLGTNNCRLLVAEPQDTAFEVVDSFSRITRLGEGLAGSGTLGEAAIQRTLAALAVCKRVIDRNRVGELRCVATEACRRATNGADFIAQVEREVGLRLEVLSQDEEAKLALLGCLPLIDDAADELLMVDIGGGSTEVLWMDRAAGGSGDAVSLPLGVVTLAESFGKEPDESEYAAMVETARHALNEVALGGFVPRSLEPPAVQMLGTSGTVTTLAAVHLGLRRYDRRRVDGLTLPYAAIAAVTERLKRLDHQGRAAHPCIGQGRADLVIAGCAILDAIHECWPISRLRVADRGVREGILNSILGLDLGAALRPVA